jgi:predicted 3-demethylubiquinone-9 3-methyltransferase (glyoxalase superfamily)
MTPQQNKTFRKIAKDNYDKSMGWSTFVECFDDEEIERFFEGFDEEDADEIESCMAELVSIWDDRYANARNERF